MGNRPSHPYKSWASTRNMPLEVPHNIQRAMDAIASRKTLTLVEAVNGGLQFKKTRMMMNVAMAPRNQSSADEFRYSFHVYVLDMTFLCSRTHGWRIFIHGKKFPYIMLGKQILYVNSCYDGQQPTVPQMKDIRRISWGQKTRFVYETEKEYRQRRTNVVHESSSSIGNVHCKICFANLPSLALIPCGHTICPTCWRRTSNTCPWCRRRVEWTQRLFLDP